MAMNVVANWSDADKASVLKQYRLIEMVCCVPGNAGFAHPIVSGSENGGFGAHFDPRDVQSTVWASLGYGALVFPSHELTVYMQPGDILRFNAHHFFHANTVKPAASDIADGLRAEQFYSEQQQRAAHVANEVEGGSATVPGREASSWGDGVEPDNGAERAASRLAQAQQMINDHAGWIDQSIVCLYFQSQQQSYMVNKHNRENPHAPVHIDENGAWQEARTHQQTDSTEAGDRCGDESDDPHEGLCEYEIARHNRIRENEAMLASLGLDRSL